jgi:hypothetical protein
MVMETVLIKVKMAIDQVKVVCEHLVIGQSRTSGTRINIVEKE